MSVNKSRFETGRTTTNTTSNAAVMEIINQGTVEAFIKAITVTQNVAAASVVGVGRPAAAGITPTAPVALSSDNGVATTLVKTALAWGTAPTSPTVFYRRADFLASIGDSRRFEFAGEGLRLAPGQTLVVWGISGTSNTYNVSVEAEQNVVVRTNP
jgi:hypothetical protein